MKLAPTLVIALKLEQTFGKSVRTEGHTKEAAVEYDNANAAAIAPIPIIDPSTSSSTLRGSISDLGVLSAKKAHNDGDRTIVDDEGRHLARKPKDETGPQKAQNQKAQKADTSCPEEDIVECFEGMTVSVGGNTTHSTVGSSCAAGCEGMCCNGIFSCDGFTGKVCKDGMSCSDDDPNYSGACYNAIIGMVHRGCNGYRSCGAAELLLVQDACNNRTACGGANSGSFSIEDPVCATQCCNNELECERRKLPIEEMVSTCGKCTGKQTKPF